MCRGELALQELSGQPESFNKPKVPMKNPISKIQGGQLLRLFSSRYTDTDTHTQQPLSLVLGQPSPTSKASLVQSKSSLST